MKKPTCWLFYPFQLPCQLWSKQFPFPSFSRRWAAQAAVRYLLLWHTSEHVGDFQLLQSCEYHALAWLCKKSFLWSHRCAAGWLPTHKGTKNLFLTFLWPQLPLDSPNTLETMQTTNLLLPSQLPGSISICRMSEFANSSGFFDYFPLPSFCSIFFRCADELDHSGDNRLTKIVSHKWYHFPQACFTVTEDSDMGLLVSFAKVTPVDNLGNEIHSCLKLPSPQESSEHFAHPQVSGYLFDVVTYQGESCLMELVLTLMFFSPTPMQVQ